MRRFALVSLALGVLLASNAASADVVQQCLDSSESGQKLRDEGKLSAARDLFRACAVAACPAPVRKSCIKWHQELVDSMPSIIVIARTEKDEDIVAAEASIDGGPAAPVSGKALPIDPGPHTISVRAKGFAGVESKVVVNTSEKNRAVKITLVKDEAATSEAPRPPSPAPTEEKRPSPPEPSGHHATALTFVFGGVAVASIAGSIVLGLTTRSARDDLACGKSKTCTDDDTNGLRARFIVADVLIGVGVVAAAAAVWTYFASGPQRTAQRNVFAPFTF
jgi:hypothetical protein